MSNPDIDEKKNLDSVFDDRVKRIVDEQVTKRLNNAVGAIQGVIEKNGLEQKHSILMTVDEELTRIINELNGNLAMLQAQINAVDVECGAVTNCLLLSEVISKEALDKSFVDLNQQLEETVKKMMDMKNQAAKKSQAIEVIEAEEAVPHAVQS